MNFVSDAGLVDRDLQWSSRAREQADTTAEQHLSQMRIISTEAQALRQVKKRPPKFDFHMLYQSKGVTELNSFCYYLSFLLFSAPER